MDGILGDLFEILFGADGQVVAVLVFLHGGLADGARVELLGDTALLLYLEGV